jgi:hypothetical protein
MSKLAYCSYLTNGYHILEDSERSKYTTFLIQLSLTAIMWRTLTHHNHICWATLMDRTKPSPTYCAQLSQSTLNRCLNLHSVCVSTCTQSVSQPALSLCLNLHAVCAQPEKRAHKDPRWLGFEGIAKIIARFVVKSSIYKDN